MVWYHVPQCPCFVVIATALPHANILSNRYLHMIDVSPIPDGFEYTVCKAKDHDILHSFLAKVMIDAINLTLTQYFPDFMVKGKSGFEITPEGFLNNDPPPVAIFLT